MNIFRLFPLLTVTLYLFSIFLYGQSSILDNTFGTNGTVRNYIASADTFVDEAHSVAIQSDGKIVSAGWSEDSYSATPVAFALARNNSDGTLDSAFELGGTVRVAVPLHGIPDEVGLAYSVAALPDGKILAGGYCSDSGFAVARFNSNGTIDNTFGVMGAATTNISGSDGTSDEALSMAVGLDGQIALARFLPGIPTAVPSKVLVPMEYTLYQNYPNPFNPSTIISYQLLVSSKVTLKIYDLLGRDVATLVNKEQGTGNYKVRFNGNNLACSVYFYRLKAGNFVETKKLVLMK